MEGKRIYEDYKNYYEIIGDKIGFGNFGSVYKAKVKNSDEMRAIKVIDIDCDDDEEIEIGINAIINELNNMKICSNENKNEHSVKFYEYFRYKKEFAIVMELCDDNLFKFLKKRKKGFEPLEIYDIMSQLNQTFKIMVEKNIVHRDIKLENILIKYKDEEKRKFIVKLTDYGISKQVTATKICKTHAGTGSTMAPEVMEGKENYTNKCDLWSIGIIIYQLAFNDFPYIGNTEVAILNKITQLGQTRFKSTSDENLNKLIRQLLVYNADQRIDWEDYFNHPFFLYDRRKDDYKKYYEKGDRIGKGAFGAVFKAKNKDTDELVAIKEVDIDNTNEDAENGIKNIINELNNMKICSEKNNYSVEFYEYFNNGKVFAIVMELCDENLAKVLKQRKVGFSPDEIKKILTQLNNTFKIMLDNKIVHRDIKLENILIKYIDKEKKDFIVKLTDYGISKQVSATTMFKTHAGTSLTMAPEILEGKIYGNKCDLWSIGVIIYQLAFKEYPYNGQTQVVLLNNIKELKQEHFKKTENEDLNNLIKKLLVINENHRIGWETYFNHSFFKSYDFKDDYNKYYEIIGDKIGKGTYGEVYKAKNKITGEIVALKKLYINNYYADEDIEYAINLIINELKTMDICYNEYSVKLYDYFHNGDEFIITMELCDDNLDNILKKKKKFTQDEIYKIMSQLNNTFKIMARNQIVHRDLKLANILVKYINAEENDFIVKLTDYGVSKQVSTTQICKTLAGTCLTMAPEVLEGGGEEDYDSSKCDLWSIGVIIYELFFNDFPYKAKSEVALLKTIKSLGLNLLKSTGITDLDNLIRGLLNRDIRERLSWDEYFKHPFFSKKKTIAINKETTTPHNNEITIKIKVSQTDKKKYNNKIYFLENEYLKRNDEQIFFEEKFKELNPENTELYINNEKKEFKKYFETTLEEGDDYTIRLIIKTKIKSCNSMFHACLHIKSIDLSKFDSSEVEDMSLMFCKCFNLEELILGNLNTCKVTNMKQMFQKCKSLKKIDFPSSFTTENVTDISLMFIDCHSLEEVNLNNFKTKNVVNMKGLFKNCFLLKKLDLSSFETEKVEKMTLMFEGCTNLEEIKLEPGKFKTTSLECMGHMFYNCSSLKTIDLSSFNTEKVKFMCFMFSNCVELLEMDLSSFTNTNLSDNSNMFNGCHKLKKINLISFDKKDCKFNNMFDDCPSLEEVNLKNEAVSKTFKEAFGDIELKFKYII